MLAQAETGPVGGQGGLGTGAESLPVREGPVPGGPQGEGGLVLGLCIVVSAPLGQTVPRGSFSAMRPSRRSNWSMCLLFPWSVATGVRRHRPCRCAVSIEGTQSLLPSFLPPPTPPRFRPFTSLSAFFLCCVLPSAVRHGAGTATCVGVLPGRRAPGRQT